MTHDGDDSTAPQPPLQAGPSASVTLSEGRARSLANLRPFTKNDPRRGPGGAKTAALRRRLKKFDEQAWATLGRLFASDDPALELEALKFWGRYRLNALLAPANAEPVTPTLSALSRLTEQQLLELLALSKAQAEAKQATESGGAH